MGKKAEHFPGRPSYGFGLLGNPHNFEFAFRNVASEKEGQFFTMNVT